MGEIIAHYSLTGVLVKHCCGLFLEHLFWTERKGDEQQHDYAWNPSHCYRFMSYQEIGGNLLLYLKLISNILTLYES